MAKKLVETTQYSLSEDAPSPPDRRTGERYVSLLRVGAMTIDGRRELCLIRNISGGGMMIRPYSHVTPGTRLTVELKQGDPVSGFVQWNDNNYVGVAFDQPIDVVALLKPANGGARPRMPRIELDCSVTLRYEGEVLRERIVNISQGGICIKSSKLLTIDSNIVVTIEGLHAAAGIVKWCEADYYGICFIRVFPVSELMGFLQEQQRQLQGRSAAAA